jgi:PAS domain S-box-containing protein
LTGYSRGEAYGRDPGELLKSGEQSGAFYAKLWETILAGAVWRGEIVNRRKSGARYIEEMTITPVLDEFNRVSHFIAIKTDITERRRDRDDLQASLRERDTLLKELHHRVKNNMQVIISLLNLSAKKYSGAGIAECIASITERVDAMASIHEMFYCSSDISRIDFSAYLARLAEHVRGIADAADRNVVITCDVRESMLPLEKAIPAGLVVNELLLNAVRHAYPEGGRGGTVALTQRMTTGDCVEISVRDDGIGLPEAVHPEDAESIGMVLITALTEQLAGELEWRRAAGTEALLRFRGIVSGDAKPDGPTAASR